MEVSPRLVTCCFLSVVPVAMRIAADYRLTGASALRRSPVGRKNELLQTEREIDRRITPM